MSYETASATDPNDLLDKLRIFALANGWTVDYSGGRTNVGGGLQAGSNNALMMNKDGLYVGLYQDTSSNSTANPTPRVAAYTYPGPWVSANGSDAQANKTTTTAANQLGGPYTAYHFFTDPARTYLHAAIEVAPGRFSHFHVGTLDKAGGGQAVAYNTGLRWDRTTSPVNISNATLISHSIPFDDYNVGISQASTALRVDSDGLVPRNQVLDYSGSTEARGGFRNGSSTALLRDMAINVAASSLTGRAALLPLICSASRTGGFFSVVGSPFDLRYVSMDNLAPGQVITLGSDQWKCFPIVRKNGTSGIENSGVMGFAYRVIS
jgi:hypothetical protein